MFRVLMLLLLTSCASPRYENVDRVSKLPSQVIRNDIDQYLIGQYNQTDTEQLRVIYYFNNELIKEEILASGSPREVSFNMYDIYLRCLRYKANGVIIAHNHMDQYFANPSNVDLETTKNLRNFLKAMNMDLYASIVITKHDSRWI